MLDGYDSPGSDFHERVQSEIIQSEAQGRVPRKESFIVIPQIDIRSHILTVNPPKICPNRTIWQKMGNRTFYRLYSLHYFSGLKGDRPTLGMQTAIQFSKSKVFVKDATYDVTAKISLKSNLTFEGEGSGLTTVRNNAAYSTTDLYEGVLDAHGTLASPITNLAVRHIQSQVVGKDNDCITFEHVNDAEIYDFIAKGTVGAQALEEGVQIAGCHRVSLRRILVDSMGSSGQSSLEIGGHLTSFEPSTDVWLSDYVSKNSGDSGLDITASNNVYVRSFRVDTPASINPGGIRVYSNPTTSMPQTKNITLDGGEVNNSTRNGIYVFGRIPGTGGGPTEDIFLRGITIRNCIQRGMLLQSNLKRIQVESCKIYSNGTEDTTATGGIETAPSLVGDIIDIIIRECTIYTNSRPATATNRRPGIMMFQTYRAQLLDNIIYDNGGDGIQINRTQHFICSDNSIYNNSASSSGNSVGISMSSTSGTETCEEGIVTNNRCYDDQSPTKNQGYGITISTINTKNIIVTNNDVRGNKTGGILSAAWDASIIVDRNPGFNPIPAVSGLNNVIVVTTTKATAPVDADFTNPQDGMIVITPTAVYFRTGGAWKSAAIA